MQHRSDQEGNADLDSHQAIFDSSTRSDGAAIVSGFWVAYPRAPASAAKVGSCAASGPSNGKSKISRAPPSGRFSAQTRPAWASMISRQMASPRPVPPGRDGPRLAGKDGVPNPWKLA